MISQYSVILISAQNNGNNTGPSPLIRTESKPSTTDVISAVGDIATAIAIGFFAYQAFQSRSQLQAMQEDVHLTERMLEMTRQEMDSNLRPWLGRILDPQRLKNNPKDGRPYYTSEDNLIIDIKNYGRVPAFFKTKTEVSDKMPTREQMIQKQFDTGAEGLLMPEESKRISMLDSTKEKYEQLIQSKEMIYLCYYMHYTYSSYDKKQKKTGEYCIITEYHPKTRDRSVQREWAE
jgi:hypothetical protein